MPLLPFEIDNVSVQPKVAASAWIAPDAWVIGDSEIGENCTILFGAVIRGDVLQVRIGARTNIQDGAVLHTSTGLTPTIIGSNVTVGHRAIIHGCRIDDNCLIGMGATILDCAHIGEGSIIGANALITKGVKIPPRSLVLGCPAKLVRPVTEAELKETLVGVDHYVEKGRQYAALLRQNG